MAQPKEVVKLCGSRRPGQQKSQTCRHPAGYKTSHPGSGRCYRVTEVRRLQVQLNIWVRIRHDAMDRLVRYSAAALRSGLEERLVKVAEIQGKLLADAVQSILRELGVADRPETPTIVRKHL